jgi:phosphoglycerate dehydrogenase-like enzyme
MRPEAAIAEALRAGRLRGAALDMFPIEPLPGDSLLWDVPNLIVTPHLGGAADVYVEQARPIVTHNLLAWPDGRTGDLRNLVRPPGQARS